MPSGPVTISRTRQCVRNSTPTRIACGQYVMSVLAFAPCAQAGVQCARLMHGARPSYSVVAMALSDGHQCQPSWFIVLPIFAPDLPNGSGGMGGLCAG